MRVILAVAPSWMASKIHLYSEGYQPGHKRRGDYRRSAYRMSLCGQGRIADDAVMASIADALAKEWTVREASPQDPRPQWSWCRNCVGHALDLSGLTRVALEHLADQNPATKEN